MTMRVIPANTSTGALRRLHFTLVDATDRVTPENIAVTGVRVTLSVDGATPATSTNDIVVVNGAAGEYYIELTQAESNLPVGTVVRGWLTPAGCALTKVTAQIGPSNVFATTVDANVVSVANQTASAGAPVAFPATFATDTSVRNALLNWEPYAGYSLARLLRVMGIVLRGTASGMETTSATFTAPAGGAQVTATVDANGNRSAVADTASGAP